MISVSTVYIGTNPVDMDSLVSDKIYKEIKDIKGIDKITTNSSLGISSVLITLKSNANTKDVINDVRNAVSRVQLPADAKVPVITEIETDTNRAFSVYIYSENPLADKSILFDRAKRLQDMIETVPGVNDVLLSAAG
jgi:multidrug efflux pump subunit AcrB